MEVQPPNDPTSLAAPILGRRPGYVLIKLGQMTAAGAEKTLGALELTGRQFDLMSSVDTGESLSQRDIGQLLNLDPNIVVDIVDDLERRGILTRSRNEIDRRRHVLTLSTAGKKLLRAANDAVTAGERKLFSSLSHEELSTLHELTSRVLAPHWPVHQDHR
jgi:DNA-binding MarR family transcriptional regulator